MENMILITDWEKVEADDFYLKPDWAESTSEAVDLQKAGKLYIGYLVEATNYAIYKQMDALQVFINQDGDIIMHCESVIINNNHAHRELAE